MNEENLAGWRGSKEAMPNLHISFDRGVRTTLALGALGLVTVQPFRPVKFVGNSMAPTYDSGDLALTVPAKGDLERGDVVVIDLPTGPIVKRVAFTAGQRIWQVRTAGIRQDLPPETEMVTRNHARMLKSRLIPDGYVYVLGDNRAESVDSRIFGAVPVEWVKRKVVNPRPFVTQ